ncbi:hypothetical protein [Halomonas sp.]|uniref:hypothetical protein n=1 Tax=Halomonas sp. TaxID=1486246 RepID=UPI003561A963
MHLRHYSRHALAAEMINALRGRSLFGDEHNGMFLAAPRRTGKTTFLKSDLKPALEAQGVLVVYADLWADQRKDPADLIAMAVADALRQYRSRLQQLAESMGVSSLALGNWLTLDVENTAPDQTMATLPDALRFLGEAAEKPVALIIDEAQQALTSEAGAALMVALKSARDQLNTPDDIRLMLIMSGSDRDKLLRLVNSHSAPFYGSKITSMPLLGRDFVEHLVGIIEDQLPCLAPVETDVLMEAFTGYGHRPQFFMSALGTALSPMADIEGRFEQAVLEAAREQQETDRADMESLYLGLQTLHQAILWRLLESGGHFRPYDSEALAFYRAVTGKDNITPQRVQTALESMRRRTPSLIWKSTRGEYAVEGAGMNLWYQARVEANAWPPQGDS